MPITPRRGFHPGGGPIIIGGTTKAARRDRGSRPKRGGKGRGPAHPKAREGKQGSGGGHPARGHAGHAATGHVKTQHGYVHSSPHVIPKYHTNADGTITLDHPAKPKRYAAAHRRAAAAAHQAAHPAAHRSTGHRSTNGTHYRAPHPLAVLTQTSIGSSSRILPPPPNALPGPTAVF